MVRGVRSILPAALVVVLTVAGCGDDGGSAGDESAQEGATSTALSSPATTGATASTVATASPSTVAVTEGQSSAPDVDDDFCGLAGEADEAADEFFDPANADPETARSLYEAYLAKVRAAAAAAPGVIKGKMDESVAAFEQFIEILRANDFDFDATSSDPAYVALEEGLFGETTSDVEEFLTDACPENYGN